jgi:oligosaccharyltransferase complex subunit beta
MTRPHLLLALAATVLLWQSCLAAKSVLVLVPDASAAASYSQFLDSLRGSGFTLDVKGVRDSSLKLREYGVWTYANLALLAPKAESELGRDWGWTGAACMRVLLL